MKLTASLMETTGEAPTPRFWHRSVIANGRLIVWGGVRSNEVESRLPTDNSTYVLNMATLHWTKLDIQPAPSPRVMCAACLCGNKFILFGGVINNSQPVDDMWSLDLDLPTAVLQHLVAHGCRDISTDLDISHVSEYPVSSGGFGDVYLATLRNGKTPMVLASDLLKAPEILSEETKSTQAGDVCNALIYQENITGVLPYAGVKDAVIMRTILAGVVPIRPEIHLPTGVEQADRLWTPITVAERSIHWNDLRQRR
ncbi:unnamed protein product [Rhizoctonia solani]|uniref:Uncharacterized protein n=1 Tax=Rhizoctonia solani TaxID=456999 RepID=A0A8H3HSY3_9AGAM|nr:unnamed protein product [Rhizoctonia solani]